MITGLDHVVVLASDIEAGASAYQTRLGCAPSWRSKGDGAARALFTLDNTTLELMAPDGGGEGADRIRAVLARAGRGIASLCFRTPDIAKMHRRLDRLTLKPEPSRRSREPRRCERREAVVEADAHRDRSDARHPHVLLEPRGRTARASTAGTEAPITAMDHVVVSTADPERAARSMARGSGSTWRSTARIRNGAG